MKFDRWRKLATLSISTMLGAGVLLWGIDRAAAQEYPNNTHYVAQITDTTNGQRQLTITGSRDSSEFWSGAIQYSAVSRQTPYRNWTRKIPFWSRRPGGPGLDHHRDLMEMFDLPSFLPMINGPITIDTEDGEQAVANARVRTFATEYDGGWLTPPGDFTGYYLDPIEVSTPSFYLPTGEDATDLLRSNLLNLGIDEALVQSFMRGEITPQQLVDLANGNHFTARDDEDGGEPPHELTLADVLHALGNIRVSIGLQVGFKFGTTRDSKIALKCLIGIEMDVKDLAVVLGYGLQPAVRKMEQTITETTDLTQDLARLQRSLNDDGRDPEEVKPPRPWYQDYIDVWGNFFSEPKQN